MNIGHKLIAGYVSIATAAGIAGYIADREFESEYTQTINAIEQDAIPAIIALKDLRYQGLRIVSSTSEFVFIKTEMAFEKRSESEQEETLIKEGAGDFSLSMRRYESIVNSRPGSNQNFVGAIDSAAKQLLERSAQILHLKKAGISGEPVLELKEQFEQDEQRYLGIIGAALAFEDAELVRVQTHLYATIERVRAASLGVNVAIVALAVFVGVALSRSIAKPFVKVKDAAAEIAHGLLHTRITVASRDEIGQLANAFNCMVDNLESANNALKAGEENYRQLFMANPHAMWVYDLDTLQFLDVNDTAVAQYGYTREEFLSMTAKDMPPEEDVPLLLADVRKPQAKLQSAEGWRHKKKDGTVIDVVVTSHALPEREGRRTRVVLANDITERKRASEALQKSETQFRLIWEKSTDGMRVTDENGIIVMANDAFCRLVGKTRGEVEGKPLSTMYASARQGQILQKYCERFKGRTVESRFERELTLWNGKVIWFDVSDSFFEFEGQLPCLFSVFRDTTERKKGEATLLLQKTQFEQLFENAPIGIVLADTTERIVHANREFQSMFGFNLEELSGKTITELIVPESHTDEGNELATRILNGRPIQKETTRRKKDGSPFDVGLYGVPILLNGTSVGLFGMYVDISERKRAEKEIQMLAASVRGISESVTIADIDERIVFVNDAFESTYGYTCEEVIGKPISILRATSDESVPVLQSTLEGGWRGELMNRRKDGSEFPIQLSTSVIRDEQRKAIAFVGVAIDITEAKRIALRQQELMTELESINKELNDFAYIVSHDLKAPLRAIGSLVNWLSTDYGEKLGDEGNEMMNVLLGRTTRMHDLIDGVLKYSRIGRRKEDKMPVELDILVPEIVDMIAPPEHIEVKVQRPLPVVLGETTRVQQVFQNLLSNAIKFIDKPKGLIEVGCERENGHWKFSVADNGPGIEERHYDKIFQIFQTLSSRDEYESTGIGLTIVKKIVETDGGKIWLESKVGKGTTFYFTLPHN